MNNPLTDLEAQFLEAIVASDYHDGRDPVENWVWFDTPFTGQTTSGVCGSLSKKGFADFNFPGTSDHSMKITRAGFDALKAYRAGGVQ